MTKIYIARHGQDEDNAKAILNGHRNSPLTATGRQQASELADGIKNVGIVFDGVYTSPLLRANTTAKVICQSLSLSDPIILDDLIERDFGSMTGCPVADIEKLCGPDIIETSTVTYFLSPPGAETFPELIKRAQRALDHIHQSHKSGNFLLVTHGDLGKMLYSAFYDLEWRDVLINFHFGNCELLRLSEDADPSAPHVIKVQQHNL